MPIQRDTSTRSLRIPLLVAFLICLVLGLASAWAQGSFVVIVHPSNPVEALKRQEISDLLLKRKTVWTDGVKATPVDLTEGSPVRGAFSQAVHQKGTAAIKSYWQKMIFSGREVPPPEKANPAEIVAFVRSNRGAIGYVPAGTALAGVKAVTVKP